MKTWWSAMSPRTRLFLALGLVLGLAGVAQWREASVNSLARALLGGLALAVLGGWLMYRGRAGAGFSRTEPLRVVSRTGLSQRCGLALVEVEGSRYFVVFGDSFAEIRKVRAPARVKSRSRRRAGAGALVEEPLS
jgi:flagellar protein FliO/FliZ